MMRVEQRHSGEQIEIPKGSSLPLASEVEASRRMRFFVLLCGGLAALGLVQGSWLPFGLGMCGWLLLLFKLFQFRLELREGFEECELGGRFVLERQSLRAGQTSHLELELWGLVRVLRVYQMRLRHSAYLQSEEPHRYESVWLLEPGERNRRRVSLKAPVMGKFALHGVELYVEDSWRLFRTWRYVAVSDWLRVLPAIPLSHLERRGRVRRSSWRQQTGALLRQLGTGSELRDIREYQPGDSRRSIVWKHSLRHRKLLCREFESEVPFTSYLIMDVGQSMREGVAGRRKLDYAGEVAAAFAKASLDQRDAVGMISFDGEIFRHDKAGHGKRQLHRLLHHLEEVQGIVKPEFSSLPISELCKLVGDFLFREGLLARKNGRSPARPRAIIEYVWDYLSSRPELGFPQDWESKQELISLVLRYFCRGVGLEIPYRYHQWVTYKAAGLEQAIESSIQRMKSGQLIVVLSDLGDILHWDGILRVLKMARQHRHHVVFLSPFSPWFAEPVLGEELAAAGKKRGKKGQDARTQKILQEILTLEQWAWRRRIQKMVGTLGIPVLSVEPKDAPALLMERLHRLRLTGRG